MRAFWTVPLAFALACGGSPPPAGPQVTCGAGTERQGDTCVARSSQATVTLESAPEAELDAAKVADFAARVCECQDTTCAIDVTRQLSEWNRTREVMPSPALMQSTRVLLACVAKLATTTASAAPPPTTTTSKPAPPPPPDPEAESIAAFKTEFRAVQALLDKLRAKDARLADQPLRLFAAVKDNYASGLQDRHAREQLMRILAKVRAATQKRLDSL